MSTPREVNTRFFKRMKEVNLDFKHIVDDGCYRGKWTELAKQTYPDAQYYLIDANDTYKKELENLCNFYWTYSLPKYWNLYGCYVYL